jgi:hypothetical protein
MAAPDGRSVSGFGRFAQFSCCLLVVRTLRATDKGAAGAIMLALHRRFLTEFVLASEGLRPGRLTGKRSA